MERSYGCNWKRKPNRRGSQVSDVKFVLRGKVLIISGYSGSMEPAFHRGDLLFLTNYQEEPVRVGDIVVFKVEGRDIPIVHRVIKLHERSVS